MDIASITLQDGRLPQESMLPKGSREQRLGESGSKDTEKPRSAVPQNKTPPSTPIEFMFVNESTNDPPEYKAARRNLSKVRSHARTFGARNYKQRQASGRTTETTEPKTLQARGVGGEASKSIARHAPSYTWMHHSTYSNEESEFHLKPFKPSSFPKARVKGGAREKWHGSLPSPREILGAGRVDPFFTYPIQTLDRDVHELMDIEMNYVVPELWPDEFPQSNPNARDVVSKAWLAAAIQKPYLFNLFLWSACCQRDFIRGLPIQHTSPQALAYKQECIRELNKVLSDGTKAITDEVILTVAGLSNHEILPVIEQNPKPFNSPLQNAGGLRFFGATNYVKEHMDVLRKLISLRGGLETLTLPVLAESLQINDISKMLNHSERSIFTPLRIHQIHISHIKQWAADVSQQLHKPASAFRQLPEEKLSSDMLDCLDGMAALSLGIDQYEQGNSSEITLGRIVRTRLAVQKQVLILPMARELTEEDYCPETATSKGLNLYECCRLTAIIFSVAVVFPTTNQFSVLQKLVREIRAELEGTDMTTVPTESLNLLLWTLVLGGVAALGKPERLWFVSQLKIVGEARLKLEMWESVEQILETFLWLRSACSQGGRQLWHEVRTSRKEDIQRTS